MPKHGAKQAGAGLVPPKDGSAIGSSVSSAAQAVPEAAVAQQRQAFQLLIQQLGQASSAEMSLSWRYANKLSQKQS